MPEPLPSQSVLDRIWLTEAVRLREEHAGPLEDSEANRHANAFGGDLAERIERRAHFLAERDGQAQALRHWRQGARLALIALALFALVAGAGLAWSALGDGARPVNVFWSLGSLLGLHALTLIGWLIGFAFMGDSGGALGRMWLWLSGKLARDAQAVHMAPALMHTLGQRRLTRWGLGALVNGFWTLMLLSSLAGLLLQFSARRYGFVWETTLLGSDTFVALTQTLGWLPAQIGFPVPDIDAIRASGSEMVTAEGVRQAWAGWLVGVLIVYGVAPRVFLALLCFVRWRSGLSRLRLDLDAPGYRLLRDRLRPSSERLGVSDNAPDALHTQRAGSRVGAAEGAVIVGIELDDGHTWPPHLPPLVVDAGVLDTREQRRQLLDRLSQQPPARLIIACDPRRSPDRGTLGLIAELSRTAASTRVWFALPEGATADPARLQDWEQRLAELGLPYFHALAEAWRGDVNE